MRGNHLNTSQEFLGKRFRREQMESDSDPILFKDLAVTCLPIPPTNPVPGERQPSGHVMLLHQGERVIKKNKTTNTKNKIK